MRLRLLLVWIAASVSLLFLSVLSVAAETGRVTVKETAIKKSPRIFSGTIETLHYADQVEIVSRAKGWVQIELADGKSGWIRSSHLSKSELSLQTGAQMVDVAASDDELTLAGKGFDRQVENNYRKQNVDVDYVWIDRMVSYHVDDAELIIFLEQGGLSIRPGGDYDK